MANLTAKFRLIDEMSAKLDNIAQSGRNALSQWERAGSAIDTAFGDAVDNTVHVAQSLDSTSDSIEELTSASTKAADAIDDLQKANNRTEEGLDGLSDEADKAKESLGGLGDEHEKTSRKSEEHDEQNRKTTDGLKELEELLVAAGIVKGLQAIGEAFVGCVEDAIEFESAITGVYKTVDGTPEQLAAIADEVKDLSLIIPSTTTEIAAVAEAAGQLGIATEDVMSFTEVMINLGEATNLSSDEAASSLAKFSNITKMSADNYENLGSTVVALGNNFATTEADIVAMATRMASAGTLAGLTEPEILALAAAVSSVGIEADAGGSSMSTLLSKITLAVETGSEELEQYASVANMTSEEFQRVWGENAVDALYAFIAGLNDTERNGASATAILDEMGITEIRLSNAVKALASNHEGLAGAVQLANAAWVQNTALATEANTRYSTLESKLAMTENAQTNLSIAIGEVFAPTVADAAEVWANMLNGVTDFVKAHPTAVKAITAITVGVGAFVVGLVGYIAVAKVAKVATTALTAAMASNPYLLLGAAIAGVVVGLTTFIATTVSATEKQEEMSYATQVQKDELKELEAEYKAACETYGEASYQAQELAWEMEELSAEYEANKKTLEEWATEFDEAIASYEEFAEQRQDAIDATELENDKVLNLVGRLDELASQTEISAAEQQEMLTIIKALNEQVPELSLSYDKYTNSLNMSAEAILAIAEAAVNQNKYDALEEQLEASIAKRTELTNTLDEAERQHTATLEKQKDAQEAYNEALAARKAADDAYGGPKGGGEAAGRQYASYIMKYAEAQNKAYAALEKVNKEVDTAEDRMQTAQKAIDDNEASIKSLSEEMAILTGATVESGDGFYTYEQAVNASLKSVQAEVNDLCAKYDEAFIAARESIDGQIGLFDEIVLEVKQSTEEMLGAWESQINYLTSYTENIKKAMDFGLDEALVKELSDGSQESAAQLDTIISKVEELGGTTDSAKKFVDDFNKKFQEVETAKDEFAGTVADMETDFSEKMAEIEERLNTSIDNMNMETDAAAAAKATMSAYVQEIIAGGNQAVAAAQQAAANVAAALAGAATTPITVGGGWNSYQDAADAGYSNIRTRSEFARGNNSDKATYGTYDAYLDAMYQKYVGGGYASGTDYAAEGWKLVGEHGPEIVEFDGGETVYPADETSRILARISDAQFRTSEATAATVKEERTDEKSDIKTIRLEINGSGAIEVDSTMDEETVVGILAAHLKPVLAGIVKSEIYEEGDLTYDF